MDGFLANVIKYLLFATNFAIFIAGCVVLGIAIYAMVDGAALVDLLDGSDVNIPVFTSAAIILIVVSVFIVILTFFGCCGAIKESKCMLGTYFTLVLVMFIIMIVGAVLGYSQSLDEVGGALKDSMKQFVDEPKDETDTTKKAITDAWNQVQTDFTCCGVHFNSTDNWVSNSDQYPTALPEVYKVPNSCCSQLEDATEIEACRKYPLNQDPKLVGCWDKFNDELNKNKDNVLIAGVVIVVIMFLNMLFAFAMCTMAGK